ncbi:VOC family protein [Actinacidiphila acididurans]|uniref:VOC family protein n=1 Tax=Actinacidiphila acididurans TaxID=2784346 RepID=A0ABS2TP52_9ACTN|nr:VOC family protein [Actinacidiphila acididurans]MBM9505104.1 VOC family protein [Actinacidiphila acididurans]
MLTNDYVPGAPDWIDLGSRDTEAAAAFYKALFGWEFRSAGPEAGGYGMFQLAGQTVAALGPLQDETATPAWTVYFESADADTTTKTVEQAGGSVRFPPMDVFDQGRLAGFTDPGGADFAVWQPGTNKGLDRVGAGALCWTELYTTDAEQAKRFYGTVLGWDTEDMPLPPGPEGSSPGTYTVVSRAGGGQEGSHGGIMQLPADMLPAGTSYWQPYFAVSDADSVVATAQEKGGTVLMPGTDLAGVGRIALLRDPEGAFFAVLKPEESAA